MKKCLLLLIAFSGFTMLNAQEKREFQLNFDSNSYVISNENASLMNSEIEKMRAAFYAHSRIEITGYTDSDGSLALNKALSYKRAKSITDYFVSKGFSGKRIVFKGENFKNPIADNNSEEGKAKNRRVNVLVTFDYNEINELKKFEDKPEIIKITSTRDTVYTFKSGTKITVPANSFVDENGKEVEGEINLSYKEFRKPIDFILAGIPMDIEEGGKRCFFNSTGMFKVEAFKDNKPVFLKIDRSLKVDFVQTASLPNTNFYQLDTLARKWNRITRITNGWGFCCYFDDRDRPKCPLQSCQMMFFVQEKGLQYAKSSVQLFDLAHITNPGNFENIQRKIKYDIQKIASSEKRLPAFGPKLSNITNTFEVREVRKDQNFSFIKIEASGKNNKSNDLLKKASWKYQKTLLYDEIFQKKWPVCIVEKVSSEYYSITLKDSATQFKLNLVSIEFNKKIKKKKADKIISNGMTKVNAVSGNMNNTITLYKTLKSDIVAMKAAVDTLKFIRPGGYNDEENKDIVKQVECFIEYNKTFRSEKETTMTDDAWLKYFDSHRETMVNRYAVDIPNTEDFKDCVTEKIARDKAIKELAALNKKRDESDEKIKNLVLPLNITSLGIYNCDIVQRLNNPVMVKAQYKTEDGKLVEPYFAYLIDSNFNGIIRYDVDRAEFTPTRFPYNPRSKNILIVFDDEGKAYLFSTEKFKNLIADKMNILILERITSKKQLENALL